MKIAFPAGTLSYRGTHIAIYDYAYFNQEILGNESIIMFDSNNPGPQDLINKFKAKFECKVTNNWIDIAKQSQLEKCDAAYIIKSGEQDDQIVRDLPNLVHAVFPQPFKEKHGDKYAFVSEWLSKECSANRTPFVPHMINMQSPDENLRAKLNISKTATIFGCYGGEDSFDIQFVHKTVIEVAEKNDHIWFIFMNIRPFVKHERVIFLPASTSVTSKANFITACDAMLHARGVGESFGLACGEFSIFNKPVITYALSPQRAHLSILGNKAITYRGPKELKNCMENFDRIWSSNQNWDQYSEQYNPNTVMKNFYDIFLDFNKNEIQNNNFYDWLTVEAHHVTRRLRSHSRKYHNNLS
jgi:hypothetical protein